MWTRRPLRTPRPEDHSPRRRTTGRVGHCGREPAIGSAREEHALKDPYQTLGVKKDASQEDIQKAYRPPGQEAAPGSQSRQQEGRRGIQGGLGRLRDPGRSGQAGRFDRGEIDASGAERPRQRYYRDFAEGGGTPTPATPASPISPAPKTSSRRFRPPGDARTAPRGRTSATGWSSISSTRQRRASAAHACPTAPRSTSTFRRARGTARYCVCAARAGPALNGGRPATR